MVTEKVDPPVVAFASAEAWLAWLDAHYDSPAGLWLRIYKQGSGVASVSYAGALDAALRYGWIDGQKRAFDDASWLQRFVPRRPRSLWSRINRDAAERLLAAGLMRPPGEREVAAARADGRWERAYEGQRTAQVPEDFLAALRSDPAAAAFFERLDRVNRFAIAHRLQTAAKPETRARRIVDFVAKLARGERFHEARAAAPKKPK
jgi:uncharacterized protein YdeI (YjbR/CyaY-like superfamily)